MPNLSTIPMLPPLYNYNYGKTIKHQFIFQSTTTQMIASQVFRPQPNSARSDNFVQNLLIHSVILFINTSKMRGATKFENEDTCFQNKSLLAFMGQDLNLWMNWFPIRHLTQVAHFAIAHF